MYKFIQVFRKNDHPFYLITKQYYLMSFGGIFREDRAERVRRRDTPAAGLKGISKFRSLKTFDTNDIYNDTRSKR